MRIHDLAKKYNVTTDDLIHLLKNAGYDVSTHMSSVDYDMLEALERHFNWSAPAKKKAKAKKKTKAKAKLETTVKAKVKVKARLKPREKPEEKKPGSEEKIAAKTKAKVTAKSKSASTADEKTETKTKAKAKIVAKKTAETAAKAKTKTTTQVKEVREERPAPVAVETKTGNQVGKVSKAPKTERKAAASSAGAMAKKPETKPERTKAEKQAPQGKKRETTKPASPKVGKAPRESAPPEKKPGAPSRKPRVRRTPGEVDAQRKAVRESVRRTLAKLETTRKTKRRKTKGGETDPADLKPIQVQDKSSVAALAESLGVPVEDIIQCCEEMGISAAATQELDKDVIELVADAIGRVVAIEAVYGESRLREEAVIDPEKLQPRAPVVTVMGHVDHGKTSILDYIRHSNVAGGEAGGITQHIGAYEVEAAGGRITFIDTPGHEAFTAMRARGAQLTDIVVLVVAADDGVMPQTIEAINHTHASGVPMVVAINKTDLPGANPDNVRQQLSQHGVAVENYGGDVVEASVSAKTGDGIDKLLEMILLQAELLELQADPTTLAQGVVIESKKEEGRGILCTVLVQQGTLEIGDVFVVGSQHGKVRSLLDHRGKPVKKAGPATPVQILGFNGVPEAGDSFIAVKNEREAREVSIKRQEDMRTRELQPAKALTLEDLYARIQQGEVKELNVIIKGDTNGSVEALENSLSPMFIEEVKVKVIGAGVGTVSESDVLLASSSNAIVIAFSTSISPKAKSMAKQKSIEVRGYDVIYEAIADIDDAMKGMLEPEIVERVLGRAEVRKVFRVSRLGLVAGSMVVQGVMERNANARVYRDDEMVFEGKIRSLKRFQDDVKEVAENFECGIGLSGFDSLQESDVIEAFVVEEKARIV
jgi:translation initiation factor IF-2